MLLCFSMISVVRGLHRTLYLAGKVSFYQPISCLGTQGPYLTLYNISLQRWKVSGVFHGAFHYLNLKGAVLGADSSAVRVPQCRIPNKPICPGGNLVAFPGRVP